MLSRLAENNIDLDVTDYDGRSCYAVAVDCGNRNMISLLDQLTETLKNRNNKTPKDGVDNINNGLKNNELSALKKANTLPPL